MSIMPTTLRLREIARALCAIGILGTSAFAQSNNVTRVPALERSSHDAVRDYVGAELVIPEQVALPPNLLVSPVYRPLLESMLQRSPTFRRQCLRIANESWVTVSVGPAPPSWTHGVRAITRVLRKPAGRMFASVELLPLSAGVEVVAHEIEHVIEQLDEIDLASKATLAHSGVQEHALPGIAFETTRATRAGLKVAKEFRQFGR
jgi:hypothetical protein